MKRTITLTCVAVLCSSFFLLSVPYVQAQDDPGNRGPCSLKTLKGSYGALFNGFVLDFPNPGQNPIVIEARDTYDGAREHDGRWRQYAQRDYPIRGIWDWNLRSKSRLQWSTAR